MKFMTKDLNKVSKVYKYKKENKKGFLLTELMIYIVLFTTVFMILSNAYIKTYKNYLDTIKKLKHIDYAYMAFERIKVDLYSNTESILVQNNIVYIKKTEKANAPYIKLLVNDGKLRYRFGTESFYDGPVHSYCYDFDNFYAYIKEDILFLKLEFDDLTLERGFLIEK